MQTDLNDDPVARNRVEVGRSIRTRAVDAGLTACGQLRVFCTYIHERADCAADNATVPVDYPDNISQV